MAAGIVSVIKPTPATGLERELLDAYARRQWTRYRAVLDQIQAQDRDEESSTP